MTDDDGPMRLLNQKISELRGDIEVLRKALLVAPYPATGRDIVKELFEWHSKIKKPALEQT